MVNTLHKQQKGLVSITVVMIIMLIVSLIAISFARLVRREQRQALDRQLNTQAFYAAESGINDAIDYLKDNPGAYETTECDDFINTVNANGGSINSQLGDGTSSYSCLLVDTTPVELSFDVVGQDISQIVPIVPGGTKTIKSITLDWQESGVTNDDSIGCPSVSPTELPPSWDSSCDPGILRVDVVDFSDSQIRSTLTDSSLGTVFLVPRGGAKDGNSVSFETIKGIAGQGYVMNSQCNSSNPNHCMTTIDFSADPPTRVYLRIKSIYKDNALKITAKDVAGDPLELTGAQATIDSTGKANDVLRRIQVRVPLFEPDPIAEFALESANSICKLLTDNGLVLGVEAIPPVSTDADNSCNPF